ncbi:MAG: lipoyl synthase [Bdellovibrionales bacterium]|nr:lipoyl synthase [Bdellovibrionales bacterium]
MKAAKPDWIKVRLPSGQKYKEISSLLKSKKLHTVCEEAKCPNIAECWSGGTATLMLMGDTCTRGCRFCAVKSGIPSLPPDPLEPIKSAQTVASMGLEYVVLTSVDRDDLEDFGAGHFAKVIDTIHRECPGVLVEALVPDFQENFASIETLCASKPEVFAHNIEVVERLTRSIRDQRSGYASSLNVLEQCKKINPRQLTKSSIMLGLGETDQELNQAFQDLRSVGVDFLTIGQYLRPSQKHAAVVEYVHPEKFETLKAFALSFGFAYVASGPLVRSSYRAGEFFISSMIRNQQQAQQMEGIDHGI